MTETKAQIAKRVRAELAERHKMILDLCAEAGVPHRAAEFVGFEFSIPQVRHALKDALAAQQMNGTTPQEAVARHAPKVVTH